MNILIAAIYDYNTCARGIMPDVLQTQINENPGATIYYLTNSYTFDISYYNIKKDPVINYLGKTGVENTLKLINGSFEHIKAFQIIEEDDYKIAKDYFKENNTIDFNKIYEGFEVGEAVLSTYISNTRDRDLDNVDSGYVKELAVNTLVLHLAVKRFLKEKEIDVVYNFNGRQDYARAIKRAALKCHIDCYNLERTRMGGYIEYYKNRLPHHIETKKKKVESCWNGSPLSENKKIEIGSRFFERQRSGESVIFPSYLKNQANGSLPEGIFNGNENVVLFNSSDDEFAALGTEFENPIFKGQHEGIEWLVEVFGTRLQDKNLIVRMHPNLAGVQFDYVAQIKDLHQKHPNVFVVLPESQVDSYALLELASKVIVFGSTLGLEANFNNKPVILLGKSFYYFSGVAYTPQDKKEVFELLSKKLKPLPKLGSFKFGYFYLKGGVKAKYYYEKNIGEGIYFKGVRIFSYSLWQRLMAKIVKTSYEILGVRLKI